MAVGEEAVGTWERGDGEGVREKKVCGFESLS